MVWLVGCKGMLGSEISRQFNENGIDFLGTDLDVDFTDKKSVSSFVAGKKIDFIVNCAAYTAVDKAESDAALCEKLNVSGPETLSSVAKKIGATLIHISTDYVFDGNGTTPYTEDTPVSPIGVYGKTKAAGENAITSNAQNYYIIRTAWLYGWAGKNFVYTMIRAMNSRDSVKVVNDQFGSPTFAGDLAAVIVKIIKNAGRIPYGIYNFTDKGEISWWDFANEIKTLGIKAGWVSNKNCAVNPCSTEEYPTPAKRPAYSVLSKVKIQNALGEEIPGWKESLEKFLNSPFFDKTRIEA